MHRSLTKAEARELELLVAQQEQEKDILGLEALAVKNQAENDAVQVDLDEQMKALEHVHMAAFQAYLKEAGQILKTVTSQKKNRIAGEYDTAITARRLELVQLKGELSGVLTRITRNLQDTNDLEVCRSEIETSITSDEMSHAALAEEVAHKVAQLRRYMDTLKRRKTSLAAVGQMEKNVVGHVQRLLEARGQDLFEGRQMMALRQFEVLPNVYCQCAILEGL